MILVVCFDISEAVLQMKDTAFLQFQRLPFAIYSRWLCDHSKINPNQATDQITVELF